MNRPDTAAAPRPRTAAAGAAVPALLLAAVLALAGCGAADTGAASKSDSQAVQADAPGRGEGGAGAAAPSSAPGASDAKGSRAATPRPAASHIVHTASLEVRVDAMEKAADSARTLVDRAEGYVADEVTRGGSGDEDEDYSRMTLKVPPARYSQLLDDLEELGEVEERKVSSEDVTGQVVDVESRLRTQRASVERVRKLMDRAEDLGDVVTLEGELSRRQADLEALEAQLESLQERTGMATVTLTLVTEGDSAPREDDEGVWDAFTGALADGWHAFYTAFRGLLVIVGSVLPFAVVLVPVAWLLLRRRRANAPAAVPAAPSASPAVPAPAGAPGAGAKTPSGADAPSGVKTPSESDAGAAPGGARDGAAAEESRG
ncbi:DUF4349 domain-containing protein [Streptomyces sp. HB2AG]|uniref:DUF4349 domain-containing protein n=1 Tax=Streptomyces sp. HB2AG TaxID=2983400 RepID=UPI0022AA268C|nr:DUF4349 domain-containing protein [Streptomyces sp. HB2AG]MCZ2525403.1 DUF4349 domain-containing protein [Streptomyces sp. HB2AG]